MYDRVRQQYLLLILEEQCPRSPFDTEMLRCLQVSSMHPGDVGPLIAHGELNCQSVTHIVGVSSEDLVDIWSILRPKSCLYMISMDSKSDTQASYSRIRKLNY